MAVPTRQIDTNSTVRFFVPSSKHARHSTALYLHSTSGTARITRVMRAEFSEAHATLACLSICSRHKLRNLPQLGRQGGHNATVCNSPPPHHALAAVAAKSLQAKRLSLCHENRGPEQLTAHGHSDPQRQHAGEVCSVELVGPAATKLLHAFFYERKALNK